MSIPKTCCVIGHRDIPQQQLEKIRQLLKREISRAIADGCTHFITGCTNKVDIMFAELVLELRDSGCEITLEADIPYRCYLRPPLPALQTVIAACNIVHVIKQEYKKTGFHARSRIMVQNSSRLIAVYDGRERGETVYTICYARAMGREVLIIAV